MVKAVFLCVGAVAAGWVADWQPLELDHISIVVPAGAPLDAAALQAAGFRFVSATPTEQQGQGTASRVLGFENIYIELIWVTDKAQLLKADPELAARMVYNDRGIVRVGLGLRRHEPGDSIPFPAREYAAAWTGPLKLRVPKTANHEPFVIVMPQELSWPAAAAKLSEELQHPNGSRRVTQVTLVNRKRGGSTPAVDYIRDANVVRFGFAADYFLEIELDSNAAGKTIDLRPQLPIVFKR